MPISSCTCSPARPASSTDSRTSGATLRAWPSRVRKTAGTEELPPLARVDIGEGDPYITRLNRRKDTRVNAIASDVLAVPLVHRSALMSRVVDLARRVAGSDANLLVVGESGTGKGLLARFIHEASARRDRKSTRLNSSHGYSSYAVFCLKKKKKKNNKSNFNKNKKKKDKKK